VIREVENQPPNLAASISGTRRDGGETEQIRRDDGADFFQT
jgi:hypothetical protein